MNQTDEAVERGARAIALVHGQDPDELAPLSRMTDAKNMPVPWWCVFEEEAAAVLEPFLTERTRHIAALEALRAALASARDTLREVSVARRVVGPIATKAQQAAWAASAAINPTGEK